MEQMNEVSVKAGVMVLVPSVRLAALSEVRTYLDIFWGGLPARAGGPRKGHDRKPAG